MTSDPFGDEIRIPRMRVPRPPLRLLRGLALGFVALALVLSSAFTVSPEEAGIVLRFGQYVRTTGPGLHFRLPFGVERVLKVPVERQLKQEFGFRSVAGLDRGGPTEYAKEGLSGESLMLTGDLNAADVEWVVQYRIVDPYKYLFRVREVTGTFRDMSEAVMRQVVGDRTVNEVLTVGRQEVADLVGVNLQKLCDQYETGLQVDQVVLQDVNPPEPVKPSFNEVNTAQQEKERLINEAQSEYNRVIPRATGESEQILSQAEGYALERINAARGDSARFALLYEAYRQAPEVTRKRIYLETMGSILPTISDKIVIDDDLRSTLPLLDLGTSKGGSSR